MELPVGILALTFVAWIQALVWPARRPRLVLAPAAPSPGVVVDLPRFDEPEIVETVETPRAPTPTSVLFPQIDAYIAEAYRATGTRRAPPPPIVVVDETTDVDGHPSYFTDAADPAYTALVAQMQASLRETPERLPRSRSARGSRPPGRDKTVREGAFDDEDTQVVLRGPLARPDTI